MGADDMMPSSLRRSLLAEHGRTIRRLLSGYYSDTEALERAVQTAAEGTVEAFRRRANGVTDAEGQQQETMEAILGAVDAAAPDQPVELVKKRVQLEVQRQFG